VPQPIVALVGRPNVGKSTLFNRLAGRRLAIVEDEPGTTRDRHYAPAEWTQQPFILVDTGGLDLTPGLGEASTGSGIRQPLGSSSRDYVREIRQQVEIAIEEADLVVFLVDASEGITSVDREIADLLRRSARPLIVGANKADNETRRLAALEFHELGLGNPYPISALHGTGTGDFLDAVVALLPEAREDVVRDAVHLAIVGRPNVGKSSLLNALVNNERAIVSAIAGTTRDSVDSEVTWDGQRVVLVDTAGIRRRGKVDGGVEKYSVLRSLAAIERSDVALLVLDATQGVTAQDAHVASFVLEAAKSVVVVVNKWDLVPDKDSSTMATHAQAVKDRLRFLDYVPVVFVSALTRQRVDKMLAVALHVASERNMRIPTSELNRILRTAVVSHPATGRQGRPLRFFYATQARVAPPVIVVFVNDRELIHFSYERYLENSVRSVYSFEGTPIKFEFRNRRQREEKAERAHDFA
jgi:GTP-binding protein